MHELSSSFQVNKDPSSQVNNIQVILVIQQLSRLASRSLEFFSSAKKIQMQYLYLIIVLSKIQTVTILQVLSSDF